LGFEEKKTGEIILRELSQLENLSIQTGIAKTGIVATLNGGKAGKTLLIRFDMDALPVTEKTGLDFSSENEGLMHACGHDGHLAIGVGLSRLLADKHQDLAGQVVFLFQPAEEGLGGALKMIEEGVLKDTTPDMALALHLWNEKPLGWLGISDGPVMSASETFQVTITGRGGHGGMPQEAVDPILASSSIINALQSPLSREIDPLDSAVITVCNIHAGKAHNVIPDQALFSGTIRSFTPGTRELLLQRFEEIVTGIAAAHRCQATIVMEKISPPVVNNPELAKTIRQVSQDIFPEAILDDNFQTMASEDMAFFLEKVPGCYFFIGSANAEKGLTAKHHQPDFTFDEEALIYGTAILAGAAKKFLSD
jgi:amidohydrolase